MMKKFLNIAAVLIDKTLSLIIPFFYPPKLAEKSGSSRIEILVKNAEKTLTGNASYFLERRFRDQVLGIIKAWAYEETSYENSRVMLDEIVENRNYIASYIVPSYSLSQLLISFGFFSSSQKILTTKCSVSHPRLATFGARVGLQRRAGLVASARIWQDVVSARLGSEKKLSESTQVYIESTGVGPRNEVMRLLVVAPGPKVSAVSYDDYDLIFFLLTKNSRIEDLADLLELCSVSAVINFEFVTGVMSGSRSDEWKRLLLNCQEIYSKPPAIKLASELIGKDVKDGSSNFIQLWGSVGQANMAQWATGLGLRLFGGNARISLAGTSLYAGEQIYANLGKAKPAANNETKKEFELCIALALHNPVTNFLFMKKLWINNRIEGDSQFSSVVEKSVENYLKDLDVYQGENRA